MSAKMAAEQSRLLGQISQDPPQVLRAKPAIAKAAGCATQGEASCKDGRVKAIKSNHTG